MKLTDDQRDFIVSSLNEVARVTYRRAGDFLAGGDHFNALHLHESARRAEGIANMLSDVTITITREG